MATPQQIQQAIHSVSDQTSFIHNLLIDTMGWEIPEPAQGIGDISYEWTESDLGAEGLEDHLLDGSVYQIQKMTDDQPWGIFILEFQNEDVFLRNRGLTGTLRKVLRGVVTKRRGHKSTLPSWEREDLLFICTYQYRHFRFAYFNAPKQKEKTAPLSLFGWNEGDADVRTLCTHNLFYLQWDSAHPDYDKWREAFSIEKVTKDFYREYAQAFTETEEYIGQANNLEKEELRLFTQTLFNRLMFLRFIEKKGWLNFHENPNYLNALYQAGGCDGNSFYQSRLCPLFFEALAVEGRQESEQIGKVPFLNGGLFERTELDNKVQDIPDEAFEPILSASGLFYRYNFTVEESTPLDIEVAVDPEMLGKVFEELVTGRHETGSYYTPRPIVSFMCREALKGYLSEKTTTSKKAIETLVDDHEISDDLTEQHATEILFYLETIKAVDPACGSGAYLLGLLQELIDIRRTLQNQQLRQDPQFLYKLKLRLISDCLYGVDIDPFATNIAKLRLWLSLSVESDTPHPLPNLDFKIETGDSILGPCSAFLDSEDALMMAALRDRAEKLVVKKDAFMNAHGDEKEALYEEITSEETQIAQETSTAIGEGVIAWHIHFAEVFMTSRRKTILDKWESEGIRVNLLEPAGFDIVLANPPYIRHELIKEIKPKLKKVYACAYNGMADLYTYFYVRAIEMLSLGGVLSFISSNKWFMANYGKDLRKFISDKCNIISITDFGELPVFETAATFPMIFIAQKLKSKSEAEFTQVKSLNPPYPDVKAIISQNGSKLPMNAIKGDIWTLADVSTLAILDKMKNSGMPLEQYVDGKIYVGIKTGLNKAFWLDEETREELISDDPKSVDLIKKLIVGDDVRKWHIRDQKRWLLYIPWKLNINEYPAVKKHLKRWIEPLSKRPESKAGRYDWWCLARYASAYAHILDAPKLVYPDIAKEPRFTIDTKGGYADMTAFMIPIVDYYLLGVLNSSCAWQYLSASAAVLGDADKSGRLRLKRQYISKVPIPIAKDKEKKKIKKLVQKCLDAQGKDCEEWEDEIDEIAARLYGVELEY